MTDYSKLKVAELKHLIKERGIASTGLKVKQQYIDALIADDGAKEGEGAGEQDASEEQQPADEEVEPVTESAPEDTKHDDEPVDDAKREDAATTIHEISEESANKRKRRSPTPPLSEESVNKKLKTADESHVDVKLPEDLAADAPAPVSEEVETPTKVLPYGTSDDVMDLQQDSGKEPEGMDRRQEDSAQPAPEVDEAAKDDEVLPDADSAGLPSKHPVTRALYIRDLVRPLQPGVLREHLLSVAQTSAKDATIEEFHLDKLRTHSFVLFSSSASAAAVRVALHDRIWPDEPMRKPLWVDFVPEDKVRDWIDTEVNKGDLTRWEVVYSSVGMDTDGPVTATLQEAETGATNSRNTAASSRQTTGAGEGMPNAPSGPRQQSSQYQQPPPRAPVEFQRPQSKTYDTLDEMYPFTQTKPKVYFQPVPAELVQRRLDEFDKEKSRDWDDRFADPSAYAEGELRRYTFEDGDRLVDGGADFGLFGRNPSRGGRGGGGRGRGRGGDRYRGGGRR